VVKLDSMSSNAQETAAESSLVERKENSRSPHAKIQYQLFPSPPIYDSSFSVPPSTSNIINLSLSLSLSLHSLSLTLSFSHSLSHSLFLSLSLSLPPSPLCQPPSLPPLHFLSSPDTLFLSERAHAVSKDCTDMGREPSMGILADIALLRILSSYLGFGRRWVRVKVRWVRVKVVCR
jgi:hypothetical protein